ncbi:proteasome subunit alpha type-4 [Anaeramoeba flamelloides]|uniref:Proteasome subunit alpha type n=1 Tax=Anaeramoeba flamelloides TaxID=1746091 RepID=A0ABQ8YPL1_9EUKA|nr:proteasome subunit alpha type-4 [Anaeramoeba flamelloides]
MSRRYDTKTTIFSPEGRLYQVEYAMEAIRHAGSAVGILATDGVILATEKRVVSPLLDQSIISKTEISNSEKLYKIDSHLVCAVAGITSDANTLINISRMTCQRHTYTYGQKMPIEQLVRRVCDIKQGYTQYGGLRPFGVSFLFAGYDEDFGFQLYLADPSGNYSGWKAVAIGTNHNSATSMLRSEFKINKEQTGDNLEGTKELNLKEATKLVVKVLAKTMDSTSLNSEKLEFSFVKKVDGKIVTEILSPKKVDELLKEHKDVIEED